MTGPQHISESMGRIVDNVRPFPIQKTLEFPKQGDLREFVWMALEGQPPERCKKLVMEARAAGILNDQDTEIFLDVAKLREA